MLYPIQRYLHTKLAVPVDSFFKETQWEQSEVDQWERKHVPLQDLPIGLLEDLAAASKKSQSVTETWQQLHLFQEEYYLYVEHYKNRYARILNQSTFLNDLRLVSDSVTETQVLMRAMISRLDELVYQDIFTVKEHFHNQVINERIKIEQDGQVHQMVMVFLVKIVHGDNGQPVVFYEYLGQNQQIQATYQKQELVGN